MNETGVPDTFEALIEALQKERHRIADAVREATLQGNLGEAQRHLDQARRIERFLSAVQQLRDAWMTPELPVPVSEVRETVSPRFQDSPSAPIPASETAPELTIVDRIFGRSTVRAPRRTYISEEPVIKTPESAFYIPILEALEKLGGKGSSQQVLDLVYERMKDHLTEDDLKTIPSGIDVRWRNTAQWARYAMVRNGLLRGDSPKGIWEISEKGRAYLQDARRRQGR